MVEMNGEIELPKQIILKDEETGKFSFLPRSVLTPTSNFFFTENEESFVVKKSDSLNDDIPEESEDESITSGDSSDNEDILYSFHGPAPLIENFPDNISNYSLPSPPYTQPQTGGDGGRGGVGGGGSGGNGQGVAGESDGGGCAQGGGLDNAGGGGGSARGGGGGNG